MEAGGMRSRSRDDFRIAIICALPIESTAVVAMLDERWDGYVLDRLPHDTNEYTVGRIFSHNVVLAYLPSIGTNSAAASINSLRAAFEGIELVLLVGVCGGVPHRDDEEIILGDVIVGTRIVQYDFGSQYPHTFKPKHTVKDSLPRHGPRMLSFLHKIDTIQVKTGLLQKMHVHLERMLDQTEFSSWRRPPPAADRVFNPKYRHKHQQPGVCGLCDMCKEDLDETCEGALTAPCSVLNCDDKYSAPPRRVAAAIQQGTHLQSQIHSGVVASGNQVMKSATHRDYIAKQENAIAFEMEGAGLWDYGPTLIIKGVCDYADSHKNKDWQKYACAAAASCMKSLLHEWSGSNPAKHPHNADSSPVREQDRQSTEKVIDTFWFREIRDRFDGVESAQFDSFRWIFDADKAPPFERYSSTGQHRIGNLALSPLYTYTGEFQRSPVPEWDPCGLKTWLSGGKGIFWITGKPGCGKSTLMKLIFENGQYKHLLDQWASGYTLLMPSFFSWRAGSGMQKSQTGFLQSTLHQMLKSHPALVSQVLEPVEQRDVLHTHQANQGSLQPTWSNERVQAIFTKLLGLKNIKTCILIDGLDEMEWNHFAMADYLIRLVNNTNVKLLVSGRYLAEFSGPFHGCKRVQLHDWTAHDIEVYVRTRLSENELLRQEAEESPADFQALIYNILRKAEGVFIWVKTAVTTLVEGIYSADSIEMLQMRLERLPAEINDLYETILRSLNEDHEGECKHFLSLILAANESQLELPIFSLAAIYDLTSRDWILRQSAMNEVTFKKLQSRTKRRLQSVCSQFVSFQHGVMHDWNVDFMHRTVYDFLKSPKIQVWLSTGRFDSGFYLIANKMARFTRKFTGSRSFNRANIFSEISAFRWDYSDSQLPTGSSILALRQLETAVYEWAGDDAEFSGDMHQIGRTYYTDFMAYAGVSYLMEILSKNRSGHGNVVILGLMLHGQMAGMARRLLKENICEITTAERVDMLAVGTFPGRSTTYSQSSHRNGIAGQDFEVISLIKDLHSQDPTTIDLYWQKLVLIVSCQANVPPGSYREPEDLFFGERFTVVIKTLLQLGADVNVLVECSPTGFGRVVLQSPVRVFRRCEALAKTLTTFFRAKAGWTPGDETQHAEEISYIIELLLHHGAKDIEETPSLQVENPQELDLTHRLTAHRRLVDGIASRLPRSHDMSGDKGWEFIDYDYEDTIMDDMLAAEDARTLAHLDRDEEHEEAFLEHYSEMCLEQSMSHSRRAIPPEAQNVTERTEENVGYEEQDLSLW